MSKDSFQVALEDQKRALVIESGKSTALRHIGMIYTDLRKYDEVEQFLSQANASNPKDYEIINDFAYFKKETW